MLLARHVTCAVKGAARPSWLAAAARGGSGVSGVRGRATITAAVVGAAGTPVTLATTKSRRQRTVSSLVALGGRGGSNARMMCAATGCVHWVYISLFLQISPPRVTSGCCVTRAWLSGDQFFFSPSLFIFIAKILSKT